MGHLTVDCELNMQNITHVFDVSRHTQALQLRHEMEMSREEEEDDLLDEEVVRVGSGESMMEPLEGEEEEVVS